MEFTGQEEIDLQFRPRSYFWPLGLETHLLSRIKGAERKSALERLIESGRLEDFPRFMTESALSDDDREALGRIHPAFMGGEYLPDLLLNEVMVARITVASTTRDVTCVYARRTKDRIHYRVVDEYGGETLSGRARRTSRRPLALGDLETFFNSAWSLYVSLDANFSDDGYDVDEMQEFVSAESEFYPEFERLYRLRIARWAAEQNAKCARVPGRLP